MKEKHYFRRKFCTECFGQ